MGLLCIALPGIWVGLLAGVSFIATPAKFYAPGLSRPVALEIGRTTFAIWNNVEWFLLTATTLALLEAKAGLFALAGAAVLNLLLLIQSMILLPGLNRRVAAILAGGRPPSSSDHATYIAIDLFKLCILGAILWKQGEALMPPGIAIG